MPRDIFDEKHFLQSLADDEELAIELVAAFLEDGPERISGLRKALEAGDAAAASKLAHSLKGMCGVIRVGTLQEGAMDMEMAAREGKLDVVRTQFASFIEAFAEAEVQLKAFQSRY